jgi:hypothetical protein
MTFRAGIERSGSPLTTAPAGFMINPGLRRLVAPIWNVFAFRSRKPSRAANSEPYSIRTRFASGTPWSNKAASNAQCCLRQGLIQEDANSHDRHFHCEGEARDSAAIHLRCRCCSTMPIEPRPQIIEFSVGIGRLLVRISSRRGIIRDGGCGHSHIWSYGTR